MNKKQRKNIECTDLKYCDYETSLQYQETIHGKMVSDTSINGYLLYVEHPPTYTEGTGATDGDYLMAKCDLVESGYSIYNVRRGGKVTYHGPGQVVVYPIINLRHFRKDIRWYMAQLEEWIKQVLGALEIDAGTKEGLRGVWVDDEKICAVGVSVRKWITGHGIALNNQVEMNDFSHIIPCGIRDYGVTSLERQGLHVDRDELIGIMNEKFEEVFGVEIKQRKGVI